MRLVARFSAAAAASILVACSSPTGDPGVPPVVCTTPTDISLAVGEYRIFDAVNTTSCLKLPGAATEQEYLVVEYAGAGNVTTLGNVSPYGFLAASVAASASTAIQPSDIPVSRLFATSTADEFHMMLRRRERAMSESPAIRFGALDAPPAAPPVFGDKDSLQVCTSLACTSFKKVGATVRYVGSPAIIYVDDRSVGGETLTQPDYDQLGTLFDQYLYRADTTNFGITSDINGDGHIAILVTPAVNDLTPDCTTGRVVGYFFGSDLIPSAAGSNRREIFYAFTTKAATSTCTAVTRARALSALPPTLIHELQHMISFNQHVLLRPGFDQDAWVNEGLSHFAEELGYRTIPDALCPNSSSCFSQFMSGDIYNAYQYLNNPEKTFLVWPDTSSGGLEERGAAWLFLRWAADQFSGDSLLGTNFTRALEQSTDLGASRISNFAGIDFPTLVGEWQMANYTENLPGFPQVGRLRYRTLNLRSTYAANYPDLFSKPYPLTPDSTGAAYSRNGVLRGGSGRHVLFQLPAGSPGVLVRLAASTASGGQLNAQALPRLAVVRIK